MAPTIDIAVAWIAALMTLMIFSFLYKDNSFYKFAEHLFVGASAAYWMVLGYWSTLVPNLFGKLAPAWAARTFPEAGIDAAASPNLWFLVPAILGVFLVLQLVKPVAYLSRWALAFIVGWAAGTNLTRFLQSDFIAQIDNTIADLIVVANGEFALGTSLTAIVVMVGVVTGLVYFFFSAEHKGPVGAASRVGVWVLMITFGASFGYTVMARISLLTGRMDFLRQVFSDPNGPWTF